MPGKVDQDIDFVFAHQIHEFVVGVKKHFLPGICSPLQFGQHFLSTNHHGVTIDFKMLPVVVLENIPQKKPNRMNNKVPRNITYAYFSLRIPVVTTAAEARSRYTFLLSLMKISSTLA